MVLDPGGVPLRVRSQVARLRPRYKDVAVAVRDRVRPERRDRFGAAVSGWLDHVSEDLGNQVLLAGWESVPDSWQGRVQRLDPRGRGESIRFVGPIHSDVIGESAFDSVIVVLDGAMAELVGCPVAECAPGCSGTDVSGTDVSGTDGSGTDGSGTDGSGTDCPAVVTAINAAVASTRPGGLVAIAAFFELARTLRRPEATVRPLVDDRGPVGSVAVIRVPLVAVIA